MTGAKSLSKGDKLKVGIVGCGFIAKRRHIPGFLRLRKDVVLQAVCDVNKPLAGSVAEEFGIPKAYSSLSEMLSKEDLSIVDICTQPHIHAPLAIEAMKSGCHILLEKPMALKVSNCDEMIGISQEYGLKLCVVHNEIFYPTFLKARELVDKGAIGKLTGMRWCRLTRRTEYMSLKDHWIHKLPGGVLGETGPHAVYMSLVFLKNVKNVDVCAKKSLEYPWVLYDDYRIELEGENMVSSIVISHANDCTAGDVELFGTEGTIRMDLQSMLLILYRREELKPISVALSSLSVASQIVKGVVSNAFGMMLGRTMLGHDILIEKFVDSVINDQPAPVTAEEGRETVRVMEMIVNKLNTKYNRSSPSL